MKPAAPIEPRTLDPAKWDELRSIGHRMLDDMLDYMEHIRERPVWQPIPDTVRAQFKAEAPRDPQSLETVYDEFKQNILPYSTGNVHPGFMGWVHGGGTPVGMLAEMLAAGLNANLGGRDHMPIAAERQIGEWMREIFRFPSGASGLFVTGTSMANLIALLVARTDHLGSEVRQNGVAQSGAKLCAYASTASHGCIAQAMDLSGLGQAALRRIPTTDDHRIDIGALQRAIDSDRRDGFQPFLVVGNAGTVDVGAIDDLDALSSICREKDLWFHVDGAFGALAMFSDALSPLLAGIEKAHSIAFDFHKWGQVPYDAGFILVRDGEKHRQTFAAPASYLRRETRGLAAGSPWPCDYGPDLSRGFRALKVWFTLKAYGTKQLGAMMEQSCKLAQYLAGKVEADPNLELMAPVHLNVVCFRYRHRDADELNARLVADLHEAGEVAPSTTLIVGKLVIRCAFVNHRTTSEDVDTLVRSVLHLGSSATLAYAA